MLRNLLPDRRFRFRRHEVQPSVNTKQSVKTRTGESQATADSCVVTGCTYRCKQSASH
jgi:hypothetical protein